MTKMQTMTSSASFLRGQILAVAPVLSLCVAGLIGGNSLLAAPPPEAEVQGLYEGTGKDGTGEFKLEVRVVGQGKGTFKVLARQSRRADLTRVELTGKTAGDAVTFAGRAGEVEWKSTYEGGVIKGECGPGGSFEVKRVEKKSPSLGKRPPAGAVVLLDGKDFSELVRANGADWYLGDMSQNGWPVWEAPLYTISQREPAEWPSAEKPLPKNWVLSKERRRADVVTGIGEDGSIQVPKAGMNSKRAFEGSFDLHVEFFIPFMPTEHSQGRGNSGVYLPNGQEVQVLDSFGETTYVGGGCGGFYNYHDPDTMEVIEGLKGKAENKFTLASLPPLTWQTYDIEYRVQKVDGKETGKPRVTVFHNGIKIHDHYELRGDAHKGNLHFQDHGNPVRYRNVWLAPVH
jgi:hypothetical protein